MSLGAGAATALGAALGAALGTGAALGAALGTGAALGAALGGALGAALAAGAALATGAALGAALGAVLGFVGNLTLLGRKGESASYAGSVGRSSIIFFLFARSSIIFLRQLGRLRLVFAARGPASRPWRRLRLLHRFFNRKYFFLKTFRELDVIQKQHEGQGALQQGRLHHKAVLRHKRLQARAAGSAPGQSCCGDRIE